MSNYMVYMSKQPIESPLHIKEVALLRRQHLISQGKIFDSVDDALQAVCPIIRFYGLVWDISRYERGIEHELSRQNVGGAVCLATGKARYLHIIKVEDENQSLARFINGK